ncbi:DUF1707 domain-containing protein [Micromonospora purpureochromogenes]|uniref:DUF1707 SHOCT-like domain-containing protein n=1 Tax=Micromonospora purpureochromogenes TaxID=47872 RepID=UPI00331B6A4C
MSELIPEPVHPGQIRTSDADRERVAAVLREAAAEGRLDLGELDERLGRVYAARTYAELEPLTHDLPAVGSSLFPPPSPAYVAGAPVSRSGFALAGKFERSGPWSVGPEFTCLAFWGGGLVDLRDAIFTVGAVRIKAYALMGGLEIWVPEQASVHVTGVGVMGGFDHRATGPGAPGAPTVTVGGFALWGGVAIKRKPSERELRLRKQEKKRRKLENWSPDSDD